LLIALIQVSGKKNPNLTEFQPQYDGGIVQPIRRRIEHAKLDAVDGTTGILIAESDPLNARLL
jgi:hypothetical protein